MPQRAYGFLVIDVRIILNDYTCSATSRGLCKSLMDLQYVAVNMLFHEMIVDFKYDAAVVSGAA